MIVLYAFIFFGLYHVYVINPAVFDAVKMMAIFGLLQAQMFFERSATKLKTLFHDVQKHIFPRDKIFSNEHITKCAALFYNHDHNLKQIGIYFNKDNLKSHVSIGTMVVTKIDFDTLTSVRLVSYNKGQKYSFERMHQIIEEKFASGYPEKFKCPFLCVEIICDDNAYDITKHLDDYLYSGNVILNFDFICMIMYDHFKVEFDSNPKFSLVTVDHNLSINKVDFNQNQKDYFHQL